LSTSDRSALALSGGEARRVHLARAPASRSDAMLLDEPLAPARSPARGARAGASTTLRDPDRATMVVVHDRAEAGGLADRLVVLLGDRVAADGMPQEVLEHPPTVEVATFLGFTGRVREAGGRPALRSSRGTSRLMPAGR
jgi:ABC-type sugar transport system ATPase subunit